MKRARSTFVALPFGTLALAPWAFACGQRTVDAIVAVPDSSPSIDAAADRLPPSLALDVAADVTVDAAAPSPVEDALDPVDAMVNDDGALRFFRSCAEIKAAMPRARDGNFTIDPDGPEGQPPLNVFCDMTNRGGGWTRVFVEDFSNPLTVNAFSRNTVTTCGGFGSILGGYKTFGNGDAVTAVFDLRGVPHTEVRVRFDFLAIDSWDHEVAYAELDNRRFWTVRCSQPGGPCNQNSDQCGWNGGSMMVDRFDGRVSVDMVLDHSAPRAKLTVGAMLDQGSGDESWGLDNVAIFVR